LPTGERAVAIRGRRLCGPPARRGAELHHVLERDPQQRKGSRSRSCAGALHHLAPGRRGLSEARHGARGRLGASRVIAPVIDRIRKLLAAPEAAPSRRDDLQIAVAVLLVEAARMDDTFDETERATIEHLLEQKFELSPDE